MSNWLKNRILYQIFPDLFCREEDGSEVPEGYCGGNLKGITKKLDYIKNWGFGAIYINPIFKAMKSHRYNVIDFYEIDQVLGTMEDFEELINECHKRDLKIILDIPFNHVSDNHAWFKDVVINPNSQYKDYFIFSDENYSRWRGSDLVELNLDNPKVMDYLFLSDSSVLKFWISKGIDGIRLDCANDLGMKISKVIRDVSHSVNPEILVMGEVFNYAGEWCKVLDSLQSYYLTLLLFSLVKSEISIHSFSKGIEHLVSGFDYNVLLNSLNILSSHDTSRVLDVIGYDINVYKILLGIQFTFPGVPVVLYGEEVGLSSNLEGEASARKAMVWNKGMWNKEIMDLYRSFIELRNSRVELQEGKFLDLSPIVDYEFISYLRYGNNRWEYSIVLINTSDKAVEKRLIVPHSHFHDAIRVVDYFSEEKFLCEISSIKVRLLPYQVMVLIPDWKYIRGYSFYKR